MAKKLLIITAIIFGNLFAFLSVGHILDSLLNYGISFKLVFVSISVIPLILAMFLYIGNIKKQLEKINSNKEK